ncbi:MAG: hypothetical protein PHP00_05165 [Thiotrichaceae bacterium]|nr:hypothetical protein [Thiotrichaceae bacterium]
MLNKFSRFLILLSCSLFLLACAATPVRHVGCYVADPALRGNYMGACQNGKAHGVGRSTGQDSYEGEFVRGIVHGKGTYYWHDGDRYTGDLRNGKAQGKGVFISKSGERKSGIWVNNVLQTPE